MWTWSVGIDALDREVRRLQQTRVVLHRAGPGLARVPRLPHVRLVPDNPVADAAPVVLRHALRKRRPRIHVGHGAGAVFRADGRPLRRADQDRHDLAACSELRRHVRIRHVRRFPIGRTVGLDDVPAQDDARVACARLRVASPELTNASTIPKRGSGGTVSADAGISGRHRARRGHRGRERVAAEVVGPPCGGPQTHRVQNSNLLKASAKA